VDEAILRGLAKDKSERFEHAGPFAEALAEALDREGRGDALKLPTETKPGAHDLTTQVVGPERKFVAILACSFEPPGRVDPEDWRTSQAGFSGAVARETERFGGTLLGEIGGTFTCVFGAPLAHEDDAERAVRSALRINEAASMLDAELTAVVRIGIATGEALVDPHVRLEHPEQFVSGGVVTAASRLLGLAAPGGIVVNDQTSSLTRDVITYERLGASGTGGGLGSTSSWRVVEVRSRLGSESDRTDTSPFVGREDELELCRRAFSRAIREREPQMLLITGEPGVGKSRVVREFQGYVDGLKELITWRQGRCLPYGEAITFFAISEIIKAHAGIYETDPPEVVATKVSAVVKPAIELEEDRGWVASRLGMLVGADSGGQTDDVPREEIFTAWRQFFEGISDSGPLVLVFEDLHWADPALLAFIEHLVDRATDVPMLVVGTARPELREHHPEFARDLRALAWVPLSALSESETAELVGGILGASVLPARVQDLLVARAAGNPLFAEQFTNLLRDREILVRKGRSYVVADDADIPVPESVTAIIAARIDTLQPSRKHLLYDAAVVGKVFWSGAVAAVSGLDRQIVTEGLHELSRKELVRHARRSAVENDEEYSFWHALTHDTAYAQIPRADRAIKHLAVADWIDRLTGEQKPDQVDLLAFHLQQVYSLKGATGDQDNPLRDRLRDALVKAADAVQNLDPKAALERYDRALEFSRQGAPSVGSILRKRGGLLEMMGDFQGAHDTLTRAIVAAEHDDDAYLLAHSLSARARVAYFTGKADDCVADRARSLATISSKPPSIASARIYSLEAQWCLVDGRPIDALGWVERGTRILDEVSSDDPRVDPHEEAVARFLLLQAQGASRVDLGDADGVNEILNAVELARSSTSPSAINLSNELGYSMLVAEGPTRAIDVLREASELGLRRGQRTAASKSLETLCQAYFDAGRWDECFSIATEQGAATAGLGSALSLIFDQYRAAIWCDRGDLESAIGVSKAFLDGAGTTNMVHILALRVAATKLFCGDMAGGCDFLARALEMVSGRATSDRTCILPECLRLCVGLEERVMAEQFLDGLEASAPRMVAGIMSGHGSLAEINGSWRDALDSFTEAIPLWSSAGCVVELAHSRASAGRSLFRLGREAEAREQFLMARTAFVDLRATRLIQEVDQWLERIHPDPA
jgi:class 3 adenylate cyclase/tetratricopeptide (TPR) repeat protein